MSVSQRLNLERLPVTVLYCSGAAAACSVVTLPMQMFVCFANYEENKKSIKVHICAECRVLCSQYFHLFPNKEKYVCSLTVWKFTRKRKNTHLLVTWRLIYKLEAEGVCEFRVRNSVILENVSFCVMQKSSITAQNDLCSKERKLTNKSHVHCSLTLRSLQLWWHYWIHGWICYKKLFYPKGIFWDHNSVI